MKHNLHKHNHYVFFKKKKHLFDIKFHTLKQYYEFEDSKLHKILSWLGLCTNKYNSPIGIELWLTSNKDFDKKYLTNNLEHLAKICELHLFQKAKSFGPKIGRFIGILVTHEDYYYILMDEYGSKWYITCCSRLEFIKE